MGLSLELSFSIECKKVEKANKIRLTIVDDNNTKLFTKCCDYQKKLEIVEKLKINFEFTKINKISILLEQLKIDNHILNNDQFDVNLKDLTQKGSLTKNGNNMILIIKAEYVSNTNSIEVHFNVDIVYKNTNNLNLKLYKVGELGNETLTFQQQICHTTHRQTIKMSKNELCNNDDSRKILIKLVKSRNRKEKEVLQIPTTVQYLQKNESIKKSFRKEKKRTLFKPPDEYSIEIYNFQEIEIHSLEEFIKQGLKINCGIGIDFTMSNGCVELPSSFHRHTEDQPSKYFSAIEKLITILDQYDEDKKYPVYGFGAFPNKNAASVSHCFNLSDTGHCDGINGVKMAYEKTLREAVFNGPTHLAKVINAYSKLVRSSLPCQDRYFILVILTDGDIDDVRETKLAIINSTDLPLSIIIIGIGNDKANHFPELSKIDQKVVLNDIVASRDIVHFVEFEPFEKKFKEMCENMNLYHEFSINLLEEIPIQVRDYMQSKKLTPTDLKSNKNSREKRATVFLNEKDITGLK